MSPHANFAPVSYIPTLKISPGYLVQYFTRLSEDEYRKNNYTNFFAREENAKPYSGEMSSGSQKRMREACELMFEITDVKQYRSKKEKRDIEYQVGFVTLTLSAPQEHLSDKQLKEELLAPFLRKLKRFGLQNYIWKAELQKNGNIHFHIFVDCWIGWREIRKIWNRLQAKFHFLSAFASKFGHYDPNSTDIRPCENVQKACYYMRKYMMKPVEKSEQLNTGENAKSRDLGKAWDCTTNLKERNDTADFATDEDFRMIDEAVHSNNLKETKLDYATVYFFINPRKSDYLPTALMDRYRSFLDKVRSGTPRMNI